MVYQPGCVEKHVLSSFSPLHPPPPPLDYVSRTVLDTCTRVCFLPRNRHGLTPRELAVGEAMREVFAQPASSPGLLSPPMPSRVLT